MGAGRKSKTRSRKEKSTPNFTVNCSAPARNIPKNELAGVIFGCKHHTIQECLRNLLFGLPAPHFSYVKHITPGLPLFLFNYSDRTLHGIFEAISTGQMNIDPHAWMNGNDSEYTPYGAQVRVRVVSRCKSLREVEFKPVIGDNYYEKRLFWFELDKRQANSLKKLFSASLFTENAPHRSSVARSNLFDALPSSDVNETVEAKDLELEEVSARLEQFNLHQDSWNCSSSTATEMNSKEGCPHSYAAVLLNKNVQQWCQPHGTEAGGVSIVDDDCRGAEPCSDEPDVEYTSSPPDEWEEHKSIGGEDKTFGSGIEVPDTKFGSSFSEDWGENKNMLSDGLVRDTEHSEYDSVLLKLIREVEALKVSQLQQRLQIDSLEHDLDNSKLEIQHLKERCNMLESGLCLRGNYCDSEGCESLNSRMNELVLLVGGYDGCSWLPDLSSYSPAMDSVKSLFSMTTVRSYESAAKLKGEIYVFGGVYNGVWYDTVESYNPTTGRCIQRPPLNRGKRSLAGASLYEKIFAIGGGNETNCFSEVEELDLNAGRWILVNSMLEPRFSPGAVDMNGSLYVAGGFDGTNYLSSLERFDPRERSWARLGSMRAKRGCHSLVAFNEKLYALGGYDGTGMVATTEVFDPRLGLWMREEPMKKCRGNFGSVVLGGKMYVIGGIGERGEVLDSIECYEEGRGWQFPGLGGLGKRSFFSAFVL